MTFLLDTCVISELVKPRPEQNVVRWVDSLSEGSLFLSVLTVGELEKGVTKLKDSERKDALRGWLEHDLVERFSGRILPVDVEVALAWGRVQGEAELKGEKLPVIDSMLAATALVHRHILATRNVADFKRCGVAILNPWEE